jgi:hypothetical protein
VTYASGQTTGSGSTGGGQKTVVVIELHDTPLAFAGKCDDKGSKYFESYDPVWGRVALAHVFVSIKQPNPYRGTRNYQGSFSFMERKPPDAPFAMPFDGWVECRTGNAWFFAAY